MFIRAVIAFLLMPGIVAFIVPLMWSQIAEYPLHFPPGLILVAIGTFGLLWCVRDFHVSGKGTLAPWEPPKNLVVGGLYRYSRNPMYVAVVLILLGWAAAFWSESMLIYAFVIFAAFHLRIVFGEEPWLARTHGDTWQQYKLRVRRWF